MYVHTAQKLRAKMAIVPVEELPHSPTTLCGRAAPLHGPQFCSPAFPVTDPRPSRPLLSQVDQWFACLPTGRRGAGLGTYLVTYEIRFPHQQSAEVVPWLTEPKKMKPPVAHRLLHWLSTYVVYVIW